MTENLESEKEMRDMWIGRFETEQKEHTKTQNEVLNLRSELKEVQLSVKTNEIKVVSS